MGKPKNPPLSESTVYRSWLAHGAFHIVPARNRRNPLSERPEIKHAFFPADQYGPFDVIGVDAFFVVKLKFSYSPKGSNDIRHFCMWEWIPIQIKGGKKCTFAITPFPDPLPRAVTERICFRSRRKAFAHHLRHPTVGCVLFVPRADLNDLESARLLLDQIWEETLKMIKEFFNITGRKWED